MGWLPSPASRERHERIRHRARAAMAADADRRWLLASGQNEKKEAASHRQPEPMKTKSSQTFGGNKDAWPLEVGGASFLRYNRANE
jgi:hypothetical protein